jgi:predicted nucleic acid-binding protein
MDESSPKHALAKTLIERNSVVLSTQVVNEVCNNLIRKAGYTEPEIQQTIKPSRIWRQFIRFWM